MKQSVLESLYYFTRTHNTNYLILRYIHKSSSMTSNALRRTPTPKSDIPHKRPRRNRQHDPSIVCHEKQHDEKAVKHLHRIERRLPNPYPLFPCIRALP